MLLLRLCLKVTIGGVPGDHFVKVHLMAVEIRAVHTGEFDLAVYVQAAAAAHSGAVDHNGVHADGGGDAVFFREFAGKLHHHQGADGEDVVELHSAGNQLLQLAGDKAVVAVAAVVRADVQVGTSPPPE